MSSTGSQAVEPAAPFSVLMSVYRATKAPELGRCLASIRDQSAAPDDVVIVYDGPVPAGVDEMVNEYSESLPIQTLVFDSNRGLGPALHDGLAVCSHELVARMDTDDLCLPDRFATQLEYLRAHPDISLVGGLLRERYRDLGSVVTVERALPEDPVDVARLAKYRNPTNHPTVMFRKSHVLRVGGYVSFPLMEDYHLFVRMLMQGMSIANIPAVFVEAEPDEQFFRRRGGVSYFLQEIRLTRAFREIGFHTPAESARFLLTRVPYRLLPTRVRRWMYKHFLRR